MKIALLQDDFPPYHGGGAGSAAYALARAYRRAGHDVLVIAAAGEPALAGESSYEGLRVLRIYSKYPERWRAWVSLYHPRAVRAVRRALADFAPDVVHAHNIHYHLSYGSLRVARRYAKKVFLTAHDAMSFNYGKLTAFIDFNAVAIPSSFDYRISPWRQLLEQRLRYNPFRNRCIRRALRGVEVVAVSNALRQALERNGLRVRAVIGNGIEVDEWRPSPEAVHAFRERHHLTGTKTVLYVGARTRAKGWPETLAALARVRESGIDAILLALGKGKGKTPPFVRSLGWLDGEDLRAAYAAADLVVQPSLCLETFGMTALEGMAAGKPVVGTCFGGVPEVVEDGVTGFIVNPLDTVAYAEKLSRLFGDAALAARMGEAGSARARNIFPIAHQAGLYLRLFGATS